MPEVADVYLLLVKNRCVISINCECLPLSIEAVYFLISVVEKVMTREIQMQTVHFGPNRFSYNFLILVRVHKVPVDLGEVMKKINEYLTIVAKDTIYQRV